MRCRFITIFALGVTPGLARAEVVYDNFTPSGRATHFEVDMDLDETDSSAELAGGREFVSRTADIATLAGSARFIDLFEVRIGGGELEPGLPLGQADLVLEIYTVSGGLPGALLWSGAQTVSSLPRDWNSTTVGFSPNVTVPDTIAWAIHFEDYRGGARGVVFGLLLEPASLLLRGSSPRVYFVQDSATGAWQSRTAGSSVDGSARINAVPAPGPAGLLGVVLFAMRRKR